ncbi:hypothetical protein lilo_1587 [Lactococcus lactis subsp. lactis IO-1]|nr:hypothetical protein lilo_1587 [Lactococcus lactis subsp. lactis IO-1]
MPELTKFERNTEEYCDFYFGHQHYSTQTNNLFQNKNARIDQIRAGVIKNIFYIFLWSHVLYHTELGTR